MAMAKLLVAAVVLCLAPSCDAQRQGLPYWPALPAQSPNSPQLPVPYSLSPPRNQVRRLAPAEIMLEQKKHANAAMSAYCNALSLAVAVQPLRATLVGVFVSPLHQGQVHVMRDSSRIYVVFRGSVNAQNWLTNFDYKLANLAWPGVPAGVKVHKGFLESYTALRSRAVQYLTEARAVCPACSVHVTGHSLGGAQALLAAIDLRLRGHNLQVWTFGQPRVGNTNFADLASTILPDGTSYRVVYNRDSVVHQPPVFWGYKHHAREIWAKWGQVLMCDGSGEDWQCSRSVVSATSFGDHMMYALGTCGMNVPLAF